MISGPGGSFQLKTQMQKWLTNIILLMLVALDYKVDMAFQTFEKSHGDPVPSRLDAR